jgi:carboxymethylenebutenolidase
VWNSFRTDQQEGIVAGVTSYVAGGGDLIHAYVARPEGQGPYPGLVWVHHAPGWDEFTREMARRMASHGFTVISPDQNCRLGHGTPDDMVAARRMAGGIHDDQVVADHEAALRWLKFLPTSNGKAGIMGMCSAGRASVLIASRVQGFDAVADLWGGGVIQNPSANNPVAPIDLTPSLGAPILGIFGNDDMGPSPAQVDQHEQALIENGKTYMFHRYDGAGHGFFYYHQPNYRQMQAMDAQGKVFAWFDQYLKA